jgi:glutathione S-transferase
VPYEERAHVPVLHLLATMPRGGRTVPLLTEGLGSLTDSTRILQHLDVRKGGGWLYPAGPTRETVLFLEDTFDEKLGPQVRKWAFAHLLAHRALVTRMMSRDAPGWERALVPVVHPLMRWVIRSRMHIDPANVARYRDRILAIFSEVDERVHDGRRFMVGERLTAADIAFCSLAAPVLFPENYRGALPDLAEVPTAMRADVEAFRHTIAGRYALRLFEEERNKPGT